MLYIEYYYGKDPCTDTSVPGAFLLSWYPNLYFTSSRYTIGTPVLFSKTEHLLVGAGEIKKEVTHVRDSEILQPFLVDRANSGDLWKKGSKIHVCAREESNLYQGIRNPSFCPLNYGRMFFNIPFLRENSSIKRHRFEARCGPLHSRFEDPLPKERIWPFSWRVFGSVPPFGGRAHVRKGRDSLRLRTRETVPCA